MAGVVGLSVGAVAMLIMVVGTFVEDFSSGRQRLWYSGFWLSLFSLALLANLVGNSLKYVEKEVRPRVRIWAEQYPDSVRLWIQDNGIGIASEHQERIFHVFERLHGSEHYPGTGIGLAIVRKGAERMGGQVGVQSQPGQGSRFWVQLPKPPDA